MADPSNSSAPPPSYDSITETTANAVNTLSEKQQSASRPQPRGSQGLIDTLTAVRAAHIRSIVDTTIYPLIEQRARQGLSHTALALLPSDVSPSPADAAAAPGEDRACGLEIVGLANDADAHAHADLQHVPLADPLDTARFWRQPAVVAELRVVLHDRLAARAQRLDEPLPPPPPPPSPQPPPPQQSPQPAAARGWFGARRKQAGAGVQQPRVPELRGSAVEVRVDAEEICLRAMSDFGLYETVSLPVVVVRVDVRC